MNHSMVLRSELASASTNSDTRHSDIARRHSNIATRRQYMKTYSLALLSCVLLAGPALAQTYAIDEAKLKNAEAITKRSRTLLLEAESRAMERCDTTRFVVKLPDFDKWTFAETTVDTIVSIEWSGPCVDASRDGDGVLIWTEKTTERTTMSYGAINTSETSNTYRSEGRFVKGKRVGLWCTTSKWNFVTSLQMPDVPPSPPGRSERHDSGCSVFSGHSNPLTDNYRKQADGSWMNYQGGQAAGSTLAPGALEAHSAEALADAVAGKTGLSKLELVVKDKSLDDLVRGSKIVLAPSRMPISLKGKRVAIVLSSQTGEELARFKLERQLLIESSAGLRGEAAAARNQFIQVSNPDRLLTNVAKVLLRYAKSVQPVDDLIELQKGGFDYALILDWKQESRFDLLGKFDNFPRSPTQSGPNSVACQSLGAFLVSPDLKAVLQLSPLWQCRYKQVLFAGDQSYMWNLSSYFRGQFGEGADDIGFAASGLDALFKQN